MNPHRPFAIVLVLSAATATAAPTRSQMKRLEASSVHIAGGSGAINSREDWQITVDLARGGKLVVASSGLRSDHNLYAGASPPYSTDDDVTWTARWTGTWKQQGRTLHLALVLAAQTCTHEKRRTGEMPEVLSCETPAATAELDCTMEDVQLVDPATLRPGATASSWRCRSTAGELGETADTWVLGRPGCLLSVGGRKSPVQLQRC